MRLTTLSSSRSYADYIARRGALYTAPDLAVAFRPDLSTSLHDTWLPTIRALVRHKVPTLFTVRLLTLYAE